MGLGTGATAAIVGGIGAAGSLGSAALGSHAAGKAASVQSNAALTAAGLQHQDAQSALDFQKQQYNTSQQELAPWLQSGQSSLANLNYLLGIGPNGSGPAPGQNQGTVGQSAPVSLPGGSTPARPAPPVQVGPGGNGINVTRPGANVPSAKGNFQLTPSGGKQTAYGAPSTAAATAPLTTGAAPSSNPSSYAGQSFNSLVNSGDPNVSPNQQTTQQWKAQGIPFQNITTADGRTVAVRSGQSGPTAATASTAPPTGIQPQSASLVNPGLGAYGSLSKGWDQTFQAPNAVTQQNDPGYQFRMDQGTKALQNSASARGNLLSGGTAKALNDYAQNSASNEYGNVYNRALNTYGTNYNTFEQGQANTYNRLASLAGLGQVTASQLGTQGANAANNAGNILMQSGQQIGQQLNNSAAATASGYVGSANAYGGAMQGTVNNLGQLYTLQQILGNQGMGGGGGGLTSNPGDVNGLYS